MIEKELKGPRESVPLVGSKLHKSSFNVFKRRKTINIEEESSKAQTFEELTTIVQHSLLFHYIEFLKTH